MKKIIYISAFTLLGIMLGFLAHAGIEMGLIKYLLSNGIVPENHGVFGHGYCVLPAWLQIALLIIGPAFGLFSGFYWWKVIYVENRYGIIKL